MAFSCSIIGRKETRAFHFSNVKGLKQPNEQESSKNEVHNVSCLFPPIDSTVYVLYNSNSILLVEMDYVSWR